MNNALESLNEALTSSFFSIAHNKCKATIITRRRFDYCPDIIINDVIIPVVMNHTYLGINLDFKLRRSPQMILPDSAPGGLIFLDRWQTHGGALTLPHY